jgi:HTH-type transcriptional regulator/antitoxin HigA
MQIHPIRNKDDHTAAVARIAELMGAGPDTPAGEELDVLATLVDAYEVKHHVIDAPDPIAAIEFRMEQQGLTRKDLEPILGSRARVSEVMTRKRSLTVAMIRRVRSELGISADLLIGASKSRMVANARRGKVKLNSRSTAAKRRATA